MLTLFATTIGTTIQANDFQPVEQPLSMAALPAARRVDDVDD